MDKEKNNALKEKAISNAIASVKIEGYKFSEYHQNLCKDVVLGRMTKQDCIKRLLADVRR